EMLRQRLDPHTIFFRNARRIGRDYRQHNVVLMQDLVVLQVVQKCGRRKFRIAREKHCGAWNDMRRFFVEATKQRVEWDFGTSRLAGQDSSSAPPSQNQKDHRRAE